MVRANVVLDFWRDEVTDGSSILNPLTDFRRTDVYQRGFDHVGLERPELRRQRRPIDGRAGPPCDDEVDLPRRQRRARIKGPSRVGKKDL